MLVLRDLGLLTKNRDKEIPEVEDIVRTADLVAIRSRGLTYFSAAVNRHGVAFVSTAVNSPEWTRAVEDGKSDLSRAVMAEERRGLISPTGFLSGSFADLASAEAAASVLAHAAEPTWMGYNLILMDKDQAFVIETHKTATHRRSLAVRDAVTNHFVALDHGAKCHADYPSSFDRLDYAREQLPLINDLDMVQAALRPQDARRERIWRTGAFSTISSAIIDLRTRTIHHADGVDAPYRAYSLA
ncbi:hypothetical protein A6A05_00580 [Magnetospirillum moscoviense]|uniref:Uncharacterized protein n=1 Tax=Magnetospirillum moscoviense TaxID=1437059 RepID=A0A178MWT0_9PROT|nr:hypothetical protein A6A05_00580 [Magnetospirillum moscoviense]